MGDMLVGCYKQMSAIKEGVIMRLQCTALPLIWTMGPKMSVMRFQCIFLFERPK